MRQVDIFSLLRKFSHKIIQYQRISASYCSLIHDFFLKIYSPPLQSEQQHTPTHKQIRNMWSVWQTVLEENEKLAKARLAAIEVFQQQIADEAKSLRDYKIQISKKSLNQLGNIQKELQTTVTKIDITKKSYFDEEHSAHGVRDKARDIEEKLKKKKGSFFQSITSLQKNSARVTSRKEELEEKSTGARNDYILSLAQANAHQNRYFTVDLQTTMTTMENYVFERIADYLTLMGRTELLTCSATQHSFSKIRDQAHQLTREYNVQCLYLLYPVLKQHIQYDYEACDNDPVTKITAEHDSAAATLSREAKSFAAKIVRENNSIRENARKLAVCQQLRDSGQRSDPNDPSGPDLETKIEEFREKIRKSETEKARSEASLECLRAGGVNVDEWIGKWSHAYCVCVFGMISICNVIEFLFEPTKSHIFQKKLKHWAYKSCHVHPVRCRCVRMLLAMVSMSVRIRSMTAIILKLKHHQHRKHQQRNKCQQVQFNSNKTP